LDYSDLKDLYAGERLFICGNAPSLADGYNLLRDERVFCCNFFSLWQEAEFKPTIYGLTEPMHSGGDDRRDLGEGTPHRLCLTQHELSDRDDWVWLPKRQPHSHAEMIQDGGLVDEAPFHTGANTPMNIGIQFGAYMGFTEFYLLGIELSGGAHLRPAVYGGIEQERRFYEDIRTKPAYDAPFLIQGYNRCLDDLAAQGKTLVNCTPSGFLKDRSRIPFVPLEDVL
jgi:hypothetical protein